MSTRCAVIECSTPCQHNQLMCKEHWFQVPKEIRDRVWRYWHNGDREQHAQACLDAIRWHAHRKSLPENAGDSDEDHEAEPPGPDACPSCGSTVLVYLDSSNTGSTTYRLRIRCLLCERVFTAPRQIHNWPPPDSAFKPARKRRKVRVRRKP